MNEPTDDLDDFIAEESERSLQFREAFARAERRGRAPSDQAVVALVRAVMDHIEGECDLAADPEGHEEGCDACAFDALLQALPGSLQREAIRYTPGTCLHDWSALRSWPPAWRCRRCKTRTTEQPTTADASTARS